MAQTPADSQVAGERGFVFRVFRVLG